MKEGRLKDGYALGECIVPRETCESQIEEAQGLSFEISGGPLNSQQAVSHVESAREQESLKKAQGPRTGRREEEKKMGIFEPLWQ